MRSKGIIMLVFFALVIVSGFFLLRHDSSNTVLRAERAKIVISLWIISIAGKRVETGILNI